MKSIKLYIKTRMFFRYLFSFENIMRENALEDIIQIMVDQLTKTKLTNDEVMIVVNKTLERTTRIMEEREDNINNQINELLQKRVETNAIIEYLKSK